MTNSIELINSLNDIGKKLEILHDTDSEIAFLQFAVNAELCRNQWELAAVDLEQVQHDLEDERGQRIEAETRLKLIRFEMNEDAMRIKGLENEIGEKRRYIKQLEGKIEQTPNQKPASAVSSTTRRRRAGKAAADSNNNSNVTMPPTKMTASFEVTLLNSNQHHQQQNNDDLDSAYSTDTPIYHRSFNRNPRVTITPAMKSIQDRDDDADRASNAVDTEPEEDDEEEDAELVDEDGLIPSSHSPIRRILDEISAESLNHTMKDASRYSVLSLNVPTEHRMISKTFFKPDTCRVCIKRINFGRVGFRCQSCFMACHGECRDGIESNCLLHMREASQLRINLIDFCPTSPPFIPPIVFYCVKEIERRGLHHEGLYRACGADTKIKALKAAFLQKRGVMPDLNKIMDTHVLCGVVKDFMSCLPEPVITYSHWNEFASYTTDLNQKILPKAVRRLPQANRHTLAYLMLHFQRVADNKLGKMTKRNLSLVLGPVIIGNSSANPSQYRLMMEVNLQSKTMEGLLDVDPCFWRAILMDEIAGVTTARSAMRFKGKRSSAARRSTQVKKANKSIRPQKR